MSNKKSTLDKAKSFAQKAGKEMVVVAKKAGRKLQSEVGKGMVAMGTTLMTMAANPNTATGAEIKNKDDKPSNKIEMTNEKPVTNNSSNNTSYQAEADKLKDELLEVSTEISSADQASNQDENDDTLSSQEVSQEDEVLAQEVQALIDTLSSNKYNQDDLDFFLEDKTDYMEKGTEEKLEILPEADKDAREFIMEGSSFAEYNPAGAAIQVYNIDYDKNKAAAAYSVKMDKEIKEWSASGNPELMQLAEELAANQGSWAMSSSKKLGDRVESYNDSGKESGKIHELHHYNVDKKTKAYSGGLSPENTARVGCHDEIAAQCRQVMAEIKSCGGDRDKLLQSELWEAMPQFAFYKEALEKNPDLKPNSKDSQALILSGTTKMWQEQYANKYDKQMIATISNNHGKQALFQDTSKEYEGVRADIYKVAGFDKDVIKEHFANNPDVGLTQAVTKEIGKQYDGWESQLNADLLKKLDLDLVRKAVDMQKEGKDASKIIAKIIKQANKEQKKSTKNEKDEFIKPSPSKESKSEVEQARETMAIYRKAHEEYGGKSAETKSATIETKAPSAEMRASTTEIKPVTKGLEIDPKEGVPGLRNGKSYDEQKLPSTSVPVKPSKVSSKDMQTHAQQATR